LALEDLRFQFERGNSSTGTFVAAGRMDGIDDSALPSQSSSGACVSSMKHEPAILRTLSLAAVRTSSQQ